MDTQIQTTYETRDPRERSHEPLVGEKRPREEDSQDEQRPSREPPQAALTFGNQSAQDVATFINGAEGQQAMDVGSGINPADNPEGHDALYIGDLQWVRWSFVSPCVLLLNPAFVLFSGLQMMIFVKLRSALELLLTTKISPSPNIKLTAKVKGEFLGTLT